MAEDQRSTNIQVLTDHKGWPVAVNEGAVWWMVAEVEPADDRESEEDDLFRLQLTNGQVVLASHDAVNRQWRVAHRVEDPSTNGH